MTAGVVVAETGPELVNPSEAVFSADRRYRYLLTRTWDADRPPAVFVMLNSSTADAFTDDPTIRRCRAFAARIGGGLVVCNLFAWRATDPSQLRAVPDPVGACNDRYILAAATPGRVVVAAWGAHGSLHDRAAHVTRMLADAGVTLACLDITGSGQPKHPLYVPPSRQLTPYPPEGGQP